MNNTIKITLLVVYCWIGISISSSFAQCVNVTSQLNPSQTEFCGAGPYTVSFTNTSTGPSAGSVNYEWILDGTTFDNTTGLVDPNDIVITNPGSYTVELIATDTIPCTDTFIIDLTIYPTPNANFNFSPDNECAETTVNFNDLSTGTFSGTDYTWDFGDGNTSVNQNPSHNFATGGTYNVTLTLENNIGCTSTHSETITVLDIPNVSISGDDGDGNTTNCLLPGDPTTTQTVDFFNTTTGATSYFWDFGDGNTSTAAEPSHTYTTYGTFDVVFIATGANGCTLSDTIEVVFERFVSASLNLDATEYSGCAPFEMTTLQNNSNNANTFVWDFGDGTPPYTTTNIAPPNHNYTIPGTYTISLTASNNCNTANATISPIVIVGKPETEFNPSITNGCAPETISFNNNSTGASPANAYDWDMGNGNTYTNTVTPPSQTYDESGVYTITLTASNACGDSTISQNITLDTIPIAEIDVDPLEECSPATFTFENYSTGNIDEYRWYLDGALYSTDSIINPMNFSYPPGNTPVDHQIV
ncbi:MAG: PKD domain-containing protein, partial [Brumimicrobium sp.]